MIFTSSTAASAFCFRSQRARITVAWRHHQSINNRSATIALAFSGGTPMSANSLVKRSAAKSRSRFPRSAARLIVFVGLSSVIVRRHRGQTL